jgi:starch phosphorylase
MDSLATLQIPAIGYGIRYEFGIFDQLIVDGWQVEIAATPGSSNGNPWEIPRPKTFPVGFGGHTEQLHRRARPTACAGIPRLAGQRRRLRHADHGLRRRQRESAAALEGRGAESFDFQAFNVGDYYGAVHAKMEAETISKVLYPNDEPEAGKELRLKQQYFFVSCSLQDMIRSSGSRHAS